MNKSTSDKNLKALHGPIAALITPIDKNGDFDSAGMRRLVRHVIKNRIKGIFILGSAGEAPCFSIEEKEKIIKTVVGEVNKKVPVLVGAGQNTTKGTVDFIKQTWKLGADYAVVVLPLWRPNWVSDNDIIRHYNEIAKKSNIPVLAYNLPSEAAPISLKAAKGLGKTRHIAGIKDSSCDMKNIRQFSRIMPVFQGNDAEIYPALKEGAAGIVSGLANIIPKKISDIYRNYEIGDFEEAGRIQEEIRKVSDLMMTICKKNPLAGIKFCLYKKGICGQYVNKPYAELTNAEKGRIMKKIMPYID